MNRQKVKLSVLNTSTAEQFATLCGSFFERSPWVAERAWERRPFASLDALHHELVAVVMHAPRKEQVVLIDSHPDLVGRLARRTDLTPESAAEQKAAGLDELDVEEASLLDRYNREYRAKFGFPFVICARENRKEAILAAFPARIAHNRNQEIAAALAEIAKIARLRMNDSISED